MTLSIIGKIPRRSRACTKCQTRFSPGAELTSWLVEVGESTFSRHDRCTDCAGKPKETVALWKSHYPDPKKDKIAADEESVGKLQEAIENGNRVHAYVMAHFLHRKGVARKVPGSDIFEIKESGECFEVVAPPPGDLSKVTVEALDGEL